MKEIANSSSNHKNVPLSIAISYQLKMANFHKSRNNNYDEVRLGSLQEEFDRDINKYFSNIPSAKTYKTVEIQNKIYRPGMVVLLRIDHIHGPVFRKIQKIYGINNNIFFQVTEIENVCFNDHYFAHEVIVNDNVVSGILNYNKFLLICACLLVKKNKSFYVATRHQI